MFPVATGAVRGFGGLYLLFIIFVPLLAVVPIAIWSFFKRPETRRLAVGVLLAPLVIFLTPFLIREVFGTAIGSPGWGFAVANTVTAVILLVILVLLPGQVAQFIPSPLMRSRFFNIALIVCLSAMLVVWLVALLLLKTLDSHSDKILLISLLYAMICALLATPVLVYSYYAMFQKVESEHHKLRVAQLALSIAVLIPTALGIWVVIKIAPLLSPPG
jgi:hypothetical protein